MEMTTSYRYERTVPRAAALRRALARQNARINETEILAADKAEVKETFNKAQIAKWNESSEAEVEKRILKGYNETVKQELKTAKAQLLSTRRANLLTLLEGEKDAHHLELEALGLTYFVCRM